MSIRLITLGPPRCFIGDEPTDLPAQKLRFALLVYLAVQKRAARESAAALFWPERDEERARHTLSQNIYELRKLLGDDWLKPQADPLEITNAIAVDVFEFERLVNAGEHEKALDLYHGDFLAGFHLKGSNEFDSWIDTKRRELKRLHHRAYRAHIESLVRAGSLSQAVSRAQSWVELDPLDDEANHALINVLAADGRRVEALAHFERYQAAIKKELDVRPLDQTRELVDRIRLDTRGAPGDSLRVGTDSEGAPTTRGFVAELKRRHVPATAAWYGATAFVVAQAVDIVVPALKLPSTITTVVVACAAIGFPIALALSWFFNITRDHGNLHLALRGSPGSALPRRWQFATALFLLIFTAAAAAVTTPVRGIFMTGDGVRCSDGSKPPCAMTTALDREAYVVLPFASEPNSPMSGELAARLVTEGMWRWNDVHLADPLRVSDALRRHNASGPLSLQTALNVAREVGAGHMILGEVWQYGDTTRIRATLYDAVANGVPLKWREIRFASGSPAPTRDLQRLADALMLAGTQLDSATVAEGATSSISALFAYDRGLRAVHSWQLVSAATHLEAALRFDTTFVQARYWLAQVMLWNSDTTVAWRAHATSVARRADELPGVHRPLAKALHALAARDYPAACEQYRLATRIDSLSFAAWTGLGDCQAFDDYVMADATSPSGWAFRGSYRAAADAYRRALRLVPSFNSASASLSTSRVGRVLTRNAGIYRSGKSDGGQPFAAWPQIVSDSLAFVPYPHTEVVTRAPHTRSPTHEAALQRNRTILRDVALEWVRAYPTNANAYEALALALETLGSIAESRRAESSALTALKHARAHAVDDEQKLRLEVAEVRMLLKAGEFRNAQRAATSILERYGDPTADQAEYLAPLASLTGRVKLLADLLERSSASFGGDLPLTGEQVTLPPALSEAALKLLAYSSFGVGADSIEALTRRAHDVLKAHVLPAGQEVAHAATLDRAARMNFLLLGPDDVHRGNRSGGTLIDAQRALGRGDQSGVRRALMRLDSIRIGKRSGETAADGLLTEIELQLAIGDTAGAVRKLDSLLDQLWTIAPYQFNQPYQPAALVRLMCVRSQLARKSGDDAVEKRWRKAAVALWSEGDPEVKRYLRTL